MSEHEKQIQIGALVEQYSKLRGEQAHITEKLNRAFRACGYVQISSQHLKATGGRIVSSLGGYQQPNQPTIADLPSLLSYGELLHLLEEKERLQTEINEVRERLMPLAPHLLQ